MPEIIHRVGTFSTIMKARNYFIAITILVPFLIGAKPKPELIRLTVINKSGLPIEMSLSGSYIEDNQYYLRIPEGGKDAPYEQIFTILPDKYSIKLYYIELWDPVYGYDCSSKSMMVEALHNIRLAVTACDITPRYWGESSMWKFGARTSKQGR